MSSSSCACSVPHSSAPTISRVIYTRKRIPKDSWSLLANAMWESALWTLGIPEVHNLSRAEAVRVGGHQYLDLHLARERLEQCSRARIAAPMDEAERLVQREDASLWRVTENECGDAEGERGYIHHFAPRV